MKFGESIDNVLFKNYFNLEGRATRSEFWWFMLFFLIFNLIVGVVVGIILGISMGPDLDPEALNYVSLGILALFFLPLLGLTVRRFHDVGRGTREAIAIYILSNFFQLILPVGGQGGPIWNILPETSMTFAWIIFGVTGSYYLIISLWPSKES